MATMVQASRALLPVVGSTCRSCSSLYIQASHDEDTKNCISHTTVESSRITCLTIDSSRVIWPASRKALILDLYGVRNKTLVVQHQLVHTEDHLQTHQRAGLELRVYPYCQINSITIAIMIATTCIPYGPKRLIKPPKCVNIKQHSQGVSGVSLLLLAGCEPLLPGSSNSDHQVVQVMILVAV